MIAIVYTPLVTTNVSGLGDLSYYNDNATHVDADVTALFNAAKSSFSIEADVVFEARLVNATDTINLHAGNFQPLDYFKRDASVIQPYVLAYNMQQSPINYNPIP